MPTSPSFIKNIQVTSLPQMNLPTSKMYQNSYQVGNLKYPDTVGTAEVSSYILFNIYVPDTAIYTKSLGAEFSAGQPNSAINRDYLQKIAGRSTNFVGNQSNLKTSLGAGGLAGGTKFIQDVSSGNIVNTLGQSLGKAATVTAGSTLAIKYSKENITLQQPLKKLQQSVAIYMPDTVITSLNHNYDVVSATEAMGWVGRAIAAGGSISESFNPKRMAEIGSDIQSGNLKGLFNQLGAGAEKLAKTPAGREVIGEILQATGAVGKGYTQLGLRSGGYAINPQIELLYTGTQFRTYIFEFRFQARSSKESQTIKDIIQVFKYYSSPSIQPDSAGRYFITPGQFDITFKFIDQENTYISKIATCVLESADINYSGAGQWATFQDGSPVDILLQLRFKETEIIYQELMSNPTILGSNGEGY